MIGLGTLSLPLAMTCNYPNIQGEVPPFRSSYQTSVFFAVLQAFCKDDSVSVCADLKGKNLDDPKLFEMAVMVL